MKHKYYDSLAPCSGHVRCYTCNKFGHVEKDHSKKTLNSYKQQVYSLQRKQPYQNIVMKRHGKDGSTNTTRIE